jgi:uncharacterized OsmC-like protein
MCVANCRDCKQQLTTHDLGKQTPYILQHNSTHVQITDSAWKFIIDEPEEDGGKNQNGNPMHHFVASLAGCENEQAAVVAGEMGIKIESISFEIDVDLDLAAFGGDNLKLKQPFQQAVIQAVVTTDATDAQVTALGDAIAARCPIRRLLVNSGATMKSTYAKAGGAAVTAFTAGAAPAEPVERFSCTAVGSGIMGDTQVQITGASWKFVLDEPVEDGGKNQNANPMQFFIASLVACENEQAAVVAGELKINISKIEWTVDVELDLAGFTGDNTELGQPYTSASISAKVTTDGTAKQVAALGKSIAARCPITQLLVNSGVKVSHTFETSSGTMPGTLYTLAPSANSFGLVALIKHLNFDVTIKPLDMTKGETRTPEFLALNPNHTCPTLEYAPGKAIVESNAILRYVANAAKAEHVYPSDPLLKAHVDSALDWQLCSAKFIGAVAYPHLGFGGTVESATAGHAALTE